jgi:hypothetical protein
MQELLLKVPDLIQMIALFLMAITLLATVIVRITPSKSDDEMVHGFAGKLLKILQWLPTIGVNPQTKKLQEAYEEIKSKDEPK